MNRYFKRHRTVQAVGSFYNHRLLHGTKKENKRCTPLPTLPARCMQFPHFPYRPTTIRTSQDWPAQYMCALFVHYLHHTKSNYTQNKLFYWEHEVKVLKVLTYYVTKCFSQRHTKTSFKPCQFSLYCFSIIMTLRCSGKSMCVVRIILLCSVRKLDDCSAVSKRW